MHKGCTNGGMESMRPTSRLYEVSQYAFTFPKTCVNAFPLSEERQRVWSRKFYEKYLLNIRCNFTINFKRHPINNRKIWNQHDSMNACKIDILFRLLFKYRLPDRI
jgi:hypothetical protein